MSAWNVLSFGNDDALDWVAELLETNGLNFIQETIEKVASCPTDEYLESPDCCRALAAVEIVASSLGSLPSDLPEEAAIWLANQNIVVRPELLESCEKAISRIRLKSELKSLVDNSKSKDSWYQVLEDLVLRLKR